MNAIFSGRKRRGKTTLAFDMAMNAGGGIIIFDPKREFRGWPGTTSNVSELDALVQQHEIIVFHPVGDSNEAFTALGEWILARHQIAMEKQWDKIGFHFTLLVDEAGQLQTPSQINPALKQILAQCRPEILNVFQTVQSPTDTFRTSKICNSDWYFFQTTHVADLERIAAIAGDHVARTISKLNEHDYVHFSEDDSSFEVESDSEAWFRPLSYFSLNESERKEADTMAQKGSMKDLFDDFMDFLDTRGEFEIIKKEKSPRREREEEEEREPRRRERAGGYRFI